MGIPGFSNSMLMTEIIHSFQVNIDIVETVDVEIVDVETVVVVGVDVFKKIFNVLL